MEDSRTKKRLLFICQNVVTYKMKKDKISLLDENVFHIDILVINGKEYDATYCHNISLVGVSQFLSNNASYDYAVLNLNIDWNYLKLIKILKKEKLPYCLIHNKFHQTHLEVFRDSFSFWYHLKRKTSLMRKYLVNWHYPPIFQFVSNANSWLFDVRQFPPAKDNIVTINHQDAESLLKEGAERINEIYFLDSNLFAHPDFKVQLVEKEKYLSELKEVLERVSSRLKLSYKVALHPYSKVEDYTTFFDEKQLCRFKDNAVLPAVVISEGSTLLESLIPYCSKAYIYRSKHTTPITDKHKAFLDYGQKIMDLYGLKIVNDLEDLEISPPLLEKMTKRTSNREIITSYLS